MVLQFSKAFRNFRKDIANSGLTIKTDKCGTLWPRTAVAPDDFKNALNELGLKLYTGTMPTLGVLLGSDDAKYDSWISKQIDEYKDYFNFLLHPIFPRKSLCSCSG